MSIVAHGKRRIMTVPIYRANRVTIGGRDVTAHVRGYYDGKRIVLTPYGTSMTRKHELAHAIDMIRHHHISEKDARSVSFSRRGMIGFDKRGSGSPGYPKESVRAVTGTALGVTAIQAGTRVGFFLRGRHPPHCNCPFHEGHRKKRPPALKGIGTTGYKMEGRTGMMSGRLARF